jgi:hypothetical protein
MARRFFYVSAGMFLLALSFHFGFTTAMAQAPGNPVVAAIDQLTLVTANGDVYRAQDTGGPGQWQHVSNVFSGSPVPAQRATWGQVKARYAPTPGTSQPQTSDR